ncbi:hypothetical protein [Actibacterium sp. 188UL27-1]|uniref:hypothetical protein n=1 Tax=Actibacterium sp. 188UL27-1 TaxID=2786961 RepID=UPI00195DFD4A|nr:hypothetical protein [Actibacterium sp. 188UL27-1]MBM7066213.1 hypothetical protein [Actibacterium sp. 188UL27-1]
MKIKDRNKLKRLTQITDAVFQTAQVRLREKSQAEIACRMALDNLEQDRIKVLSGLKITEQVSPAQIVVDAQWLRWAETQRGKLNMSLARARAATIRERTATQRSFGRHQVALELTHKTAE